MFSYHAFLHCSLNLPHLPDLQVWTTFRIKSTAGFSVGYAILELIGGSFSVLQMFLLSYNYGKQLLTEISRIGNHPCNLEHRVLSALLLLHYHY